MSIDSPEKFDPAIMVQLAPIFRLKSMPDEYRKPFRALVYLLSQIGLQLDVDKAIGHRLYSEIENSGLYVLLSFLIDYSLHIPPNTLELYTADPSLSTVQDIHPPLRFLALMINYFSGFGKENTEYGFVNEKLFYSTNSIHLASLINKMHTRVDQGRQNTFYNIDETTKLWLKTIDNSKLKNNFPEIHDVRIGALSLRKKDPNVWHGLNPLDFDIAISLPRFVITKKGLKCLSYWSIHDGDRELEDDFIKKAITANSDGFNFGDSYANLKEDAPLTLIPFRFIQKSLIKEMYNSFSRGLFREGFFRCPLTTSVGQFVPCKKRTFQCERITCLEELPTLDCLFFDIIETKFGGVKSYCKCG